MPRGGPGGRTGQVSLNETTISGGAGITVNTGGTVHITNGSTIEKNIATLNGGIFLVARGTVTLNGATVEDNEPNNCVGLTC